MTTAANHSTCGTCGRSIEYVIYDDHYGNTLDAWWAHHVHPADGHDATPMKAR